MILLLLEKDDKADCSNYWGISLLKTMYKILSNILLSRLTSYEDITIGDSQCVFWHNRTTADNIMCISQIHKGKEEWNRTMHQLFAGPKIAYDPVMQEVLYNIPIEFGIPI